MAETPQTSAQKEIFTFPYAPEQQKQFEEALAKRDYRTAQTILQHFPSPPRIGKGTKAEMRQRILANIIYHRTQQEGHLALERMLYEDSLPYRAPGDPDTIKIV